MVSNSKQYLKTTSPLRIYMREKNPNASLEKKFPGIYDGAKKIVRPLARSKHQQ
uniref:Uncharacterized protein n=1 Tax=Manihot esculenta TaxID=3983 RepID=A0A2C9V9Z0_MANES